MGKAAAQTALTAYAAPIFHLYPTWLTQKNWPPIGQISGQPWEEAKLWERPRCLSHRTLWDDRLVDPVKHPKISRLLLSVNLS
jgi:hypothetical protein